ncbi:hypothetical protein JXA48_00650 [Candidatus Woesearchaeota archaeon]|nr:hypothetical protein [Candidatus Woesearchaeota archaeon]
MKSIWLLLVLLLLFTSCSYNQKSFTHTFVNSLNEIKADDFNKYFSEEQQKDFDVIKELLFNFTDYGVMQFSSSEDQKFLINSKYYDVDLTLFLKKENSFVILNSKFDCKWRNCKITQMSIDKSSMIKIINNDYFSDNEITLNFADYLEMPLMCYEGKCQPPINATSKLPNLQSVESKMYCNGEKQQVNLVQVQQKDACEDFKSAKKVYDAYCLEGPKTKIEISFEGKFNNCETGIFNLTLETVDDDLTYTKYYFEK